MRLSADARTEQVFMITMSANCASLAFVQPRAISSCSTAALSAMFIWQPYVSKK